MNLFAWVSSLPKSFQISISSWISSALPYPVALKYSVITLSWPATDLISRVLVSSTWPSVVNKPFKSFPPSATYLAAICNSWGKLWKNCFGVSLLTWLAFSSKLASINSSQSLAVYSSNDLSSSKGTILSSLISLLKTSEIPLIVFLPLFSFFTSSSGVSTSSALGSNDSKISDTSSFTSCFTSSFTSASAFTSSVASSFFSSTLALRSSLSSTSGSAKDISALSFKPEKMFFGFDLVSWIISAPLGAALNISSRFTSTFSTLLFTVCVSVAIIMLVLYN